MNCSTFSLARRTRRWRRKISNIFSFGFFILSTVCWLLIRSHVSPLFYCCLRLSMWSCWFCKRAVNVVSSSRIAAIGSGADREVAGGCRIVIFSSLLVSVPASVIATGHVLSSIIFRNAPSWASFAIPAFLSLRRLITAIVTISLSLYRSRLTSHPRPQIRDAISFLLCLSSIGKRPSRNWRLVAPDFKFLLAVHCLTIDWIMPWASPGVDRQCFQGLKSASWLWRSYIARLFHEQSLAS